MITLRSSDVYFVEYDLKISRALLHYRAFTSLYFHRQVNTSSKNRLRLSDILHNVDLMIVKYIIYIYISRAHSNLVINDDDVQKPTTLSLIYIEYEFSLSKLE